MSIQLPQQKRRKVLLGLLALALLGGAGCGKGKRATVSGQVTFNGRPLTAGTIRFVDKKNRTGSGTIDPKGNYTIPNAPVGEVTIVIDVPKRPMMMKDQMKGMKPPPGMGQMKPPDELAPKPGGATMTDPSKIVPIPDKYSTEDSPLKFTVAEGDQTYDIKLTP